jgi:hypothetical protein
VLGKSAPQGMDLDGKPVSTHDNFFRNPHPQFARAPVA